MIGDQLHVTSIWEGHGSQTEGEDRRAIHALKGILPLSGMLAQIAHSVLQAKLLPHPREHQIWIP